MELQQFIEVNFDENTEFELVCVKVYDGEQLIYMNGMTVEDFIEETEITATGDSIIINGASIPTTMRIVASITDERGNYFSSLFVNDNSFFDWIYAKNKLLGNEPILQMGTEQQQDDNDLDQSGSNRQNIQRIKVLKREK